MKIHAIQTGTVAIKPNQQEGRGHGLRRLLNTMVDGRWTAPLPILAWAIEHAEGVLVVDTGETSRATTRGYFPWWHPYFRRNLREWVRPEEEIGPQLRGLGIDPLEVGTVVMTHLHTDHAGGLEHFPRSEILVARRAFELGGGFAGQVRGFLSNRWPSWFSPRLIDLNPDPIGPFPSSLPVTKEGDVALVPTSGHTVAHLSVVVRDEGVTYFIAGDASYTQRTMEAEIVDGVSPDEGAARTTLRRIHEFVRAQPTVYLPTHDPGSPARLAARETFAAGRQSSGDSAVPG